MLHCYAVLPSSFPVLQCDLCDLVNYCKELSPFRTLIDMIFDTVFDTLFGSQKV